MSQSAQQKGQNNNTSSFGSSGALTNTLGSVQAAIGSGIPSIGQGMTKPIRSHEYRIELQSKLN